MATVSRASTPAPGTFAEGYFHGRHDLLYALAHGHQWAADKLEAAKLAALSTWNRGEVSDLKKE